MLGQAWAAHKAAFILSLPRQSYKEKKVRRNAKEEQEKDGSGFELFCFLYGIFCSKALSGKCRWKREIFVGLHSFSYSSVLPFPFSSVLSVFL